MTVAIISMSFTNPIHKTYKSSFEGSNNEPSEILENPETSSSDGFFSSLLNRVFSTDDSENTEATQVMGSTEGSFLIADGTANYNVPINVVPGTAGMQPDISINYSSGGANSLLGEGFSLGGLSAIIRGGANKTNNTTIDGMDFDSNDKFYLDGQLLVCVSGTYGANGSAYRIESDKFTNIIAYSAAGSGPAYFRAWTKDGLIYEYAVTANSRIEGQGLSDVVIWAVNKISDTKGNYMNFTYYENNTTGESYITQIDYTGNTSAGLSLMQVYAFIIKHVRT